jgi:predicted Rossmann fold nucleotide-binding protein DprA/Smf involved in DNA uptake
VTEPDASAQVLAVLTEAQQKVFAQIPLDHAVSLEALAECGLPVKEILQALTILEIKGLIYTLPGGLVSRR